MARALRLRSKSEMDLGPLGFLPARSPPPESEFAKRPEGEIVLGVRSNGAEESLGGRIPIRIGNEVMY